MYAMSGPAFDPIADAVDFFRRIGPAAPALRQATGSDRRRLLDGVARLAQDHLVDGAVVFPAAAWIWSAAA